MAYSRSGPTFSFFGVDRTNRTVTLFPDREERAAQIGRLSRRRAYGGTVTVRAAELPELRTLLRNG